MTGTTHGHGSRDRDDTRRRQRSPHAPRSALRSQRHLTPSREEGSSRNDCDLGRAAILEVCLYLTNGLSPENCHRVVRLWALQDSSPCHRLGVISGSWGLHSSPRHCTTPTAKTYQEFKRKSRDGGGKEKPGIYLRTKVNSERIKDLM